MGALVILLICSDGLMRNQCTEETARVSVSIRLEQITCGVGALAAPTRMDLGDKEFVRVICRMR